MAFMALTAAAALLATGGTAASPHAIAGRWATPARNGVVEITPCGASICGRLVDSDGLRANPNMRDVKNRDAAQNGRPLKGLLMLQGFSPVEKGWDGGTVYNPEDGGTYKGTITMVDNDTLKLRGCIVWPLCKSQTWKRIR
jgi:uncharacterized protein (DUF2147 family)